MDLPIKNAGFPWLCKRLPEGIILGNINGQVPGSMGLGALALVQMWQHKDHKDPGGIHGTEHGQFSSMIWLLNMYLMGKSTINGHFQ